MVSLQTSNYENDPHAAQDRPVNTDDNKAFISGSVYTDVNGERQDPNVWFIDTLWKVMTGNLCVLDRNTVDADAGADVGTDEHTLSQRSIPTISYAIRG